MAGRNDAVLRLLELRPATGDYDCRAVVPPMPLSFDRVNEGRSPTLSGPLFRLPFELLGNIVEYLTPSSLASLALVSRDARQLARSAQFASIHLDYGNNSIALVKLLEEERLQRLANNGLTRFPSLGTCIRRITVATKSKWVSLRHNLTQVDSIPREVRNQRLEEAYISFFDQYIPLLHSVLNRLVLPHLDLLDWEDKIALPRSFFASLGRSSIKHLKLLRVLLDEEFEMELPRSLAKEGWALRSLNLELRANSLDYENPSVDVSPLFSSMLRHCAPTLEEFTWENDIPPVGVVQSSNWDLPPFTRLRRLQLPRVEFSDSSVLEALVQDNLRVLVADTECTPVRKQFFKNRGKISSLETYGWDSIWVSDRHDLNFLRSNTQLSKLSISFPVSADLYNDRILPLLATSFTQLSSLHLLWQGNSIPESAFEIIGTLRNLEQLHLGTGDAFSRSAWVVNHNLMRKYLCRLGRLRKLAFSRDTYDNDVSLFPAFLYYNNRISRRTGEPMSSGPWEKQHRKFAVSQAFKYARVLPRLEWIYLGQIPMGIKPNDSGKRIAVPLSKNRDRCCTSLKNIFEWEDAVWGSRSLFE